MLEIDTQKHRPTADSQVVLPHLAVEQIAGMDPNEKGTRRREVWLESVRNFLTLRDVGHRTYVTRKNRRVGVATSGQDGPNRWHFGIGDRHYDVIVLLCHRDNGDLLDFIIPRPRIQHWESFAHEAKTVRFDVRQVSHMFYLESGHGGVGQEINQYLANYRLLE